MTGLRPGYLPGTQPRRHQCQLHHPPHQSRICGWTRCFTQMPCGWTRHFTHRPVLFKRRSSSMGKKRTEQNRFSKEEGIDALPRMPAQTGRQEKGRLTCQARCRSQAAQERPGRTKPGCGRGKGRPPIDNASTGLAGRISSAQLPAAPTWRWLASCS